MNNTRGEDTAYYDELLLKESVFAYQGKMYGYCWEAWKESFAKNILEVYNKKTVFV